MKIVGLLKVCIFVGIHWMQFVSHVKFRQLQTQRYAYQNNRISQGTPISATNVATEIFLKVVLNT
jgi:hypothetical protein